MSTAAPDQAARLRQLFAQQHPGGVSPVTSEHPPRVALAPAPVGPTTTMITVASGKGGVGKTSLAVNLSIAMAQFGCRTTLLDADIGTANADVLCGMSPRRRLDDLFRVGSRRLTSAAEIAVKAPGGFMLVPGAVGIPRLSQLAPADRDQVLDQLVALESQTDLFLIDAGAGVGPDVLGFVEASDATLLVVTPDPTSIADAYALVKSAKARGASPSWWVVINAAAHEAEAISTHGRLASCAARFLGVRLPMLGWVHADKHIAQAVRKRRPFMLGARRSRSSREVRSLARGVMSIAEWMGRAQE